MNESKTNDQHAYSVDQALEDGTLIDVSDLARKIGCPCPTYITTAAWNSDEIACNEEQVIAALLRSEDLEHLVDFLFLQKLKTCYDGRRKFEGSDEIRVHFDVSFDAVESFTATIYLFKWGEWVDFRAPRSAAGGSFYIM